MDSLRTQSLAPCDRLGQLDSDIFVRTATHPGRDANSTPTPQTTYPHSIDTHCDVTQTSNEPAGSLSDWPFRCQQVTVKKCASTAGRQGERDIRLAQWTSAPGKGLGRPTTHKHPALRTAGRQTPLAVEKGARDRPAKTASDNISSGRPLPLLLCGTAWSEPGYRQLGHPTGLVRHGHADRRGAPTMIRDQRMRRLPAWPVDRAMDDRGTASHIGYHPRRRPSHSKTFAARMKDQGGIVQHRRCGRKHRPRSFGGGDVKVVHLQLGLNLDALSSRTAQLS